MLVVDLEGRKVVEVREDKGAVGTGVDVLWNYASREPVFIGRGPEGGTGSHRAVAVFFSPLTGGPFVSSAGGVGLWIKNNVALLGRSERPVVIRVSDGVEIIEVDGIPGGVGEATRVIEEEVGCDGCRVLVAGRGGRNTNFGAVVSLFNGVPDFFGRGGLGSVLWRKNVVGLVFENKYVVEAPPPESVEATKKYRERGTLLGNVDKILKWIPFDNWRSVFLSGREREERLLEVEWKKLEGMASRTCGEGCPAVCKKIYKGVKLDYEPFVSLVLQTGIFSIREGLELIHLAEEEGVDAIEFGNAIAAVLEGENRLGDAERAMEVAHEILKGASPFSKGVFLGSQVTGYPAVYIRTRSGGIAPPQYINPGFFAPLPLVGKFMTFYGFEALDGKEWGRRAGERFLRELSMEDLGICRFHRKWREPLVDLSDTIVKIKLLNILRRSYVMPPEGRARDVIRSYYREWGREVEPFDWYFSAKEGVDEVLPTLTF